MGFRRSIGMTIGVMVVLSLFVVSAHAEEETITFESDNTTTFASAPFNFNGEGVANYAFFTGVSTQGPLSGQGVSQSAPTGNSCTLPDGSSGIELKLVDHVAVTRFEPGDLLFERGQPGDLTACLDLTSGRFHEEGRVHITGGTGRFRGASGYYDATQDGQVLVPPGAQALQFGYATATYRYTLTVPK